MAIRTDRASNANPLDGRRGDRVLVAANVLASRILARLRGPTAQRLLLSGLVGLRVQLANEVGIFFGGHSDVIEQRLNCQSAPNIDPSKAKAIKGL